MQRDILSTMDPRALGARLSEARKARPMTQQDAAEAIGVARTTLVAIEKGQRRVSPEELVKLAGQYGRQVSDLLREQPPMGDFAAQLRAPEGAVGLGDALERAKEDFRSLCQDYLYLEQLCGVPLTYRYPEVFQWSGPSARDAAEDLADQERDRLGVGDGPILVLRELLEANVGLRIFAMPLPSRVSGMFVYDAEAGGCVALNRAHPPERRRWTLPHEYAHFLTSRYQGEVTLFRAGGRVSEGERFADAFARCFLMPSGNLRRQFRALTQGRQASVTDLLTLSDRYGVSAEAMALRLEELALIPEGAWERIKARGLKVREAQGLLSLAPMPDFDDLPPRHSRYVLPLRYRYLAALAYARELITETQLARYLRSDVVDARETVESLRSRVVLSPEGEAEGIELDLAASLGGEGRG